MNRKTTGWRRARALLLPGMFLAALPASSCKDAVEEACGPCGTVATGDFSVSGDAQLDGFFQAVGTFTSATGSITGDFNANVAALGAAYGVTGEITVDKVIAAIDADFKANVEGGVNIAYKPPQCSASLDVSIQAQAQCEAKAKCEGTIDPGSASVKCEGSCSGSCDAECTGDFSCEVTAPSVACEGKCEGSCEFTAAAKCEGTCHGTCSGSCSATDSEGKCNGACEGNCQGSCELKAAASCTGKCSGKCLVNQGSASCKGDVSCRGSCSGQCSGGCTGNFTPPKADVECEASAKCEAQASARANASLECTPPQLDLTYGFTGNATAQAAFTARLGELKARGSAIVQGAARLRALVDGKVEVDGKLVTAFNPSPLAGLVTSLSGSIEAVGDFDIPAGRLVCVVPAFEKAVEDLNGARTQLTATVAAQGKFVAFLGGAAS